MRRKLEILQVWSCFSIQSVFLVEIIHQLAFTLPLKSEIMLNDHTNTYINGACTPWAVPAVKRSCKKKNSLTTSIWTNTNGRPLNGWPWASQVTSDGDLSRGRVAGSGSAPCPSISFRLAVTERDSAEKLWALHCRGLTTDWTARPSTATAVPSWFLTTALYKWLAKVNAFQQMTSDNFWQMHLRKCKYANENQSLWAFALTVHWEAAPPTLHTWFGTLSPEGQRKPLNVWPATVQPETTLVYKIQFKKN